MLAAANQLQTKTKKIRCDEPSVRRRRRRMFRGATETEDSLFDEEENHSKGSCGAITSAYAATPCGSTGPAQTGNIILPGPGEVPPPQTSTTSTPSRDRKEIRVLIFGCMGDGKSETATTLANSALDKGNPFKAGSSASSVTKRSAARDFEFEGDGYRLIDTPGWFDPAMKDKVVKKEMKRFPDMVPEGLDVILFVVALDGRLHDKHYKAWRSFVHEFGEEAEKHVILAFTKQGEMTEEKVLERAQEAKAQAMKTNRQGNDLVNFLEKHVFFGNLDEESRQRDRTRALRKIRDSVSGDRYRSFSEELLCSEYRASLLWSSRHESYFIVYFCAIGEIVFVFWSFSDT